jgi:hypothetical protein
MRALLFQHHEKTANRWMDKEISSLPAFTVSIASKVSPNQMFVSLVFMIIATILFFNKFIKAIHMDFRLYITSLVYYISTIPHHGKAVS